MNIRHKLPLNRQVLDQAAEFLVEFNTGDADRRTCEQFDAWLQVSPEHVRAYLELMPAWEDGSLHPEGGLEDAREIIARARSHNVLALDASRPKAPPRWGVNPPRIPAIAALMLVLISASAIWLYLQRGTYITAIGEQRSLALEDGSTVQLNSRSRLQVRFTEGRRVLRLLEGQALFQVAQDPRRPFIVQVNDTHVRALGTRFDVYRKSSATIVTVTEGKVGVAREGVDRTVPVEAGEQVTLFPGALSRPARADTAAATAWTQRQLVFDRTPLSEVAEEYNRYNVHQITVKDHPRAPFHVTGVFSTTDTVPLLRFLRDQEGVVVQESGREIRIIVR